MLGSGGPSGRRMKADPMTGSTNSVSSVDVMMPPITTVARGRWISLPTPVEMAIGMKPAASVIAVASTGRSRVFAASMMAWRLGSPDRSVSRMASIRIWPLSTAIPDRAMKPTAALTLNGMPRHQRANMAPTAANGMPV